LAVSSKGKRKVSVKGRQYFWYVENENVARVPEQGFVEVTNPRRFLHIISANKRFIVHYRIPEAGEESALLLIEGPEFPRLLNARQIEVPRWRHDSNRYPTADFVRRLIGWCLGLD
jgi:hypothetical protein